MWGTRVLASVMQDVRLGLRLLARHRLFAIFSIVSLALGIGGTSAVFSLYDAIVLRPLPVHEPERLITLAIHSEGRPPNSFMPFPQFEAMRQGNQSLDGLFARTGQPTRQRGRAGTTGIASVMAVTGAYHGTLGLRPAARAAADTRRRSRGRSGRRGRQSRVLARRTSGPRVDPGRDDHAEPGAVHRGRRRARGFLRRHRRARSRGHHPDAGRAPG